MPMLESTSQASVPRDAFPPTPPGPEGSNGNGLLRVQWVAGAWLKKQLSALSSQLLASISLDFSRASPRSSRPNLAKVGRIRCRDTQHDALSHFSSARTGTAERLRNIAVPDSSHVDF